MISTGEEGGVEVGGVMGREGEIVADGGRESEVKIVKWLCVL